VNSTTITVADGVTTIVSQNFTLVLSNGSVVITPAPCPEEPAPFECSSHTVWDAEPVVFGFKPVDDGEGGVQFFPPNSIGEFVGPAPESVWIIHNDGAAIRASFSLSPHLTGVQSATVSIASSVEGEEPIEFEIEPSGSGLTGTGTGSWQLVAGQTYCVTVLPARGE
jgi:hypothetical protein